MIHEHAGNASEGNLAFGKQCRLLSAHDYSRVFDKTDCKVSGKAILLLAAFNTENTARLGLVVSKKNARLAVQRNRIKRMARESFRFHRQQLPDIDIVLLTRRGIAELSNEQLQKELARLWLALSKRAAKTRPST